VVHGVRGERLVCALEGSTLLTAVLASQPAGAPVRDDSEGKVYLRRIVSFVDGHPRQARFLVVGRQQFPVYLRAFQHEHASLQSARSDRTART